MPRQRRNFTPEQESNLGKMRAKINADGSSDAFGVVVVARGKANMFLDGNPIIYAGAIEKVIGNIKTSDFVCVTDHAYNPICVGMYNATSAYAVRVTEMAWERAGAESVGDVVRRRIREAFELRRDLGLTNGNALTTTCYRLVNSEGDRLSGLNADVYGDVVVCSSTAAWIESERANVVRGIAEVLGASTKVVWRRDAKMYEAEGQPVTGDLISCYDAGTGAAAAIPGETRVFENGVQYAVDIEHGHKTGFYVDQRENRMAIRDASKGKKVLDICCYTGGFALNAAVGGAASVVAVDSSESALRVAEKNAELNKVLDKIKFVRADAFDFMQEAIDRGESGTYDVVVLDPPKFAPSKQSLTKALPKYIGLNKRAMALLRPGGLLVTCSCSGAVTQEDLMPKILENAARASGKTVTIASKKSAGGDQPIDPCYEFGEYLTVMTARVR